MGDIRTKRIYDTPEPGDGIRVLVDRIWPRGMTKERAQLTAWMRELAPSTQLRTWFGHDPGKFAEFAGRYEAELSSGGTAMAASQGTAAADLRQLLAWAEQDTVTLLYAASDERHNQAVVLRRYVERLRAAGSAAFPQDE